MGKARQNGRSPRKDRFIHKQVTKQVGEGVKKVDRARDWQQKTGMLVSDNLRTPGKTKSNSVLENLRLLDPWRHYIDEMSDRNSVIDFSAIDLSTKKEKWRSRKKKTNHTKKRAVSQHVKSAHMHLNKGALGQGRNPGGQKGSFGGRLTHNRLTKAIGLFNPGKKSETVYRDDVLDEPESVPSAVEEDSMNSDSCSDELDSGLEDEDFAGSPLTEHLLGQMPYSPKTPQMQTLAPLLSTHLKTAHPPLFNERNVLRETCTSLLKQMEESACVSKWSSPQASEHSLDDCDVLGETCTSLQKQIEEIVWVTKWSPPQASGHSLDRCGALDLRLHHRADDSSTDNTHHPLAMHPVPTSDRAARTVWSCLGTEPLFSTHVTSVNSARSPSSVGVTETSQPSFLASYGSNKSQRGTISERRNDELRIKSDREKKSEESGIFIKRSDCYNSDSQEVEHSVVSKEFMAHLSTFVPGKMDIPLAVKEMQHPRPLKASTAGRYPDGCLGYIVDPGHLRDQLNQWHESPGGWRRGVLFKDTGKLDEFDVCVYKPKLTSGQQHDLENERSRNFALVDQEDLGNQTCALLSTTSEHHPMQLDKYNDLQALDQPSSREEDEDAVQDHDQAFDWKRTDEILTLEKPRLHSPSPPPKLSPHRW